MGSRSDELAQQFETANQEFTETVMTINDQDWNNLCPAENWTVGVTTHHVADCYSILTDTVQALAAGEPRPLSKEMIDDINATHAREHATCTRAETIQILQDEGARQAEAIRALGDEDLDRHHDLPMFGSDTVPLEHLVRVVLVGHHEMHLPSIRAAAPSAGQVPAQMPSAL